ncbi:hypothetical protein BDV3_001499 [Batrachochytrium dendrobatidis]|nr:hypothetical protein QVD99_005365 [Batrachochytrium dendrobatidis]
MDEIFAVLKQKKASKSTLPTANSAAPGNTAGSSDFSGLKQSKEPAKINSWNSGSASKKSKKKKSVIATVKTGIISTDSKTDLEPALQGSAFETTLEITKEPAVETVDFSAYLADKAKLKQTMPVDDEGFADSRGNKPRAKTDDGLNIYSAEELQIGKGGGIVVCYTIIFSILILSESQEHPETKIDTNFIEYIPNTLLESTRPFTIVYRYGSMPL